MTAAYLDAELDRSLLQDLLDPLLRSEDQRSGRGEPPRRIQSPASISDRRSSTTRTNPVRPQLTGEEQPDRGPLPR